MTIRELEVAVNGIQQEVIQMKTNGNPRDIEVIEGKTLNPGKYKFTLEELKTMAQYKAREFYGEKATADYCL